MPEDVKLPPAGTGDSSTTMFDVASIKAEAKAYTPTAPAAAAAPVPAPSSNAPSFRDALAGVEKPAVVEQAPAAIVPGATATPPAGDVLDIPDTQLVRLKVNGVDKIVPYGEAKTQMMLRQHYTQEMQSLRAKEAEVEAAQADIAGLRDAAQRANRYEALLTTEESLSQYVEKAFPGRFSRAEIAKAAAQIDNGIAPTGRVGAAVQQPDPEGLASIGDASAIVAAKTAQLEAEFGRTLSNVEKKLVERAETLFGDVDRVVDNRLKTIAKAQRVSAIDTKIAAKIDELLTAHPHVAPDDPEYADYVRHKVIGMKPKTQEEMFQAIEHIIVGKSQAILERVTNSRVVAEREKLTTHGVEPPNGTPVALPTKDSFQKSDGSWDWDGLKSQARAFRRA